MKDPNAPRHPTSAYLLFCQQKRDKLRLAHPTMTFLDITKELGQQWTQLEEEERRVSKNLACNSILLKTIVEW